MNVLHCSETEDLEICELGNEKWRRLVALVKHGASLYLKFEGLKLSVVIIFNTFHWLKNFESCSVVSIALLCVSLLLRQRKVILC